MVARVVVSDHRFDRGVTSQGQICLKSGLRLSMRTLPSFLWSMFMFSVMIAYDVRFQVTAMTLQSKVNVNTFKFCLLDFTPSSTYINYIY